MTDEPTGPPPTGAGPCPLALAPGPGGAVGEEGSHEACCGAVPLKSWSRLPMGTATRHGRRAQIAQDGPDPMIILTRRNGSRFGLNPDLIERVDETPDTVVLLVTGSRYVVQEGLDEVVALMRTARASVLTAAEESGTGQPGSRPSAGRAALRAVRGMED